MIANIIPSGSLLKLCDKGARNPILILKGPALQGLRWRILGGLISFNLSAQP